MTGSNADTIVQWLSTLNRHDLPQVIQALLRLEKEFKPSQAHTFELLGVWQLTVIGGKQSLNTTSPRQGKLVPRWLNVQQIYQENTHPQAQCDLRHGTITNQVQIGVLTLELSGPWKFDDRSHILAFDFVCLTISFLGRSLIHRPVRGGQDAEAKFWEQPIKALAFFRFFWMTPQAIAARGRGGGIALWKRVNLPSD